MMISVFSPAGAAWRCSVTLIGSAVGMIGVGEQTGALDAMLGKIADFYEEEVDTAPTCSP